MRYGKTIYIGMFIGLFLISPVTLATATSDLCKEYAANGKYDAAIEECTKQIYGEIQVQYLEYSYNNRGAAYANKEQYDQAIGDYNKAIGLNPQYATAYYNRAIAHAKKKHFKKALTDFNRVLELNPQHAAAREGRQQVLAEINRSGPSAVDKIKTDADGQASTTATKVVIPTSSAEKPAPSAGTHTAKQSDRNAYTVQLGMFRIESNAATLAARFREKGYDVFVNQSTAKDGGTLHWVVVGAFKERQEAAKLAAEIREKENITPIIVSY